MQQAQLGYPLYLNQQQVPGPATLHHGPTAPPPMQGLGEYFTEPLSGLGQVPRRPSAGWWKTAAQVSPMLGALGQAADAAADKVTADQAGNGKAALSASVALALVGIGLLIRGTAGYIVGKAMAPRPEDETTYAWSGVAASVLLGTLGLGIEGAVALYARKG